ncbi:MAG: excinuclease ABC subunit A [Crocinitomicaceae bacterium]|nr:excinuclease ABC subunit A [Crocinitomicaceae bacterium]
MKKTTKTHILIKGARVHNLKNVSVAIPRNKLTVITGVSGSGKSSLAFDTLYAEGHRRYIESLSAYARLFLGRMENPDVDDIKGISPAIAIEQKVNSSNSRSTVGTSTEIYEYLKLLFARIGKTISPISNTIVTKDYPEDVLNWILKQPNKSKIAITCPINETKGRTLKEQINIYLQQGFSRAFQKNKIIPLSNSLTLDSPLSLVIDRVSNENKHENKSRIFDSLEIAFHEGKGICDVIVFAENIISENFNNQFIKDNIKFEEPSLDFFSFNNPYGACKKCEGFGKVLGINHDLVIPNPNLSILSNAIVCWKGEKMSVWKEELINNAHYFDFPIHQSIRELSEFHYELLWKGNEYFKGLNAFFEYLEKNSYKIQYRVMLSRYRGKTQCNDCNGSRLRADASYVKINNLSITDIIKMDVKQAFHQFSSFIFEKSERKIADRLIAEITTRLKYLIDVGLGYLTLDRPSNTLSGGESQRINLATSIGSSLIGSMYILDEPSIGLHAKDSQQLISVLKKLRDLGNSVIVVEHDEEMMKAADEIIDIGPDAGRNGGEIVFQGDHSCLIESEKSLTADYLTGKKFINIPKVSRKSNNNISIKGAYLHNLKNINATIPLNTITVVTGVSGSGKSTLITEILFPYLQKLFNSNIDKALHCKEISGDIHLIESVEFIDQNPIGKSSRSNPVTYVKAYDEIRQLYANEQLAKINGFKAGNFSFNVDGGRCEKCLGEGKITISMQFMADVNLVCDECNGNRFKENILEVKYKGKSISDVLNMTIEESLSFFNEKTRLNERIYDKMLALKEVGLEYVQLGQSSNTLSGGEAQRIKLASFLYQRKSSQKKLFIFDEPTTGLHFHDVKKLIKALNDLVEMGHHVIIVEHNLDIIKSADWIIDLGPEGGNKGGNILYQGPVKDFVSSDVKSHTKEYLKKIM